MRTSRPQRMIVVNSLLAIALLLFGLGQAQGETPADLHKRVAQQAGYHTHDGFFLRMLFGSGFHSLKTHGTALGLSNPVRAASAQAIFLAFGGALSENLILHGNLDLHAGVDTSLKFAQTTVGLGVTYYFTPANIYLSPSIGFVSAGIFKKKGTSWTDMIDHRSQGFGLSLSSGKEWWVSANWGVGLALQGNYSRTSGGGITIDQGGLMLMLSATYN